MWLFLVIRLLLSWFVYICQIPLVVCTISSTTTTTATTATSSSTNLTDQYMNKFFGSSVTVTSDSDDTNDSCYFLFVLNNTVVNSVFDAYYQLQQLQLQQIQQEGQQDQVGTSTLIKPYHSINTILVRLQLYPEVVQQNNNVDNNINSTAVNYQKYKQLQFLRPFLQSPLVISIEEDRTFHLSYINENDIKSTTISNTTVEGNEESNSYNAASSSSTFTSWYLDTSSSNDTKAATSATISTTTTTTTTRKSNSNGTDNNTIEEHSMKQYKPVWGLDRIDQQFLPLDGLYHSNSFGADVYVYIIGTGIDTSHSEFTTQANTSFGSSNNNNNTRMVNCGYNAILRNDTDYDDGPCIDHHGHGTHIGGIIGGMTYGVAKNVNLYSIQAISDYGTGTISSLITSIDYILTIQYKTENRKSIVVLPSGIFSNTSTTSRNQKRQQEQNLFSPTLYVALDALVKANVLVIVPAGDDNVDSCEVVSSTTTTTPSSTDNDPHSTTTRTNKIVPSAVLIVASTDPIDYRSTFSNWGSCIDIFAPGSNITSSWITKKQQSTSSSTSKTTGYKSNANKTISGTDMAAANVAGVAALYWSSKQWTDVSSAKLITILLADAIPGVVNDTRNSPNILINTQSLLTPTTKTPTSNNTNQPPNQQQGSQISGINDSSDWYGKSSLLVITVIHSFLWTLFSI